MRVLIFGGTGFLGSHLTPTLLADGHEVTVMTRRKDQIAKLESQNVKGMIGDLLHPEEFIHILPPHDVVVFIAMPLEFGRISKKKFKEIRERTTKFVSTALAVGEKLECPTILTLGTSYRTGPGEVADETWPIERFGLTKAGDLVDRLIEEALERGQSIIRMIPGQIYGPGGQFMEIYRRMKSGRFGIIGNGENRIPRVHVEDCAEVFALAVNNLPVGESFIVADDTPCTMREFTEFMGECMGITKIRTIPKMIARLVLGGRLIETLNMDCVVTNAKAKSELGWNLKYPSYRDGLPPTISAIKAMDTV
ncbi:MAG: NAD-dependent epimerase/dehydratase family protein [Candidatus Thorarchaeota archaeon]|jgi:nucleoside-diphosphate-sugar epimerase